MTEKLPEKEFRITIGYAVVIDADTEEEAIKKAKEITDLSEFEFDSIVDTECVGGF